MVWTQVVHVMVWWCVCFLISVSFMYRLCAPYGQIRGYNMKALYRPCICHVYILFCWHPTAVSDHNVPGGISDMRQPSLENNSELSLGKLYHVNCHRHTILPDQKKKKSLSYLQSFSLWNMLCCLIWESWPLCLVLHVSSGLMLKSPETLYPTAEILQGLALAWGGGS